MRRNAYGIIGALSIGFMSSASACADEASDTFASGGRDAGVGSGGGAGNAGGGNAGSGGSTDAGGGGGGVTGGTGGAPAFSSKRYACRQYLLAYCNRLAECIANSPLESCIENVVDECPDYYFSEGSTHTAEGLLACTDEWNTLTCEQIGSGLQPSDIQPSCSTPGTRQAGETCRFHSQCQSLHCSGAMYHTCGTCSRLAAPGERCDAPGVTCPSHQACSSTGSCLDKTNTFTPPSPPKGPGEVCGFNDTCVEGYRCVADPNDSLIDRCTVLPGIGQPCIGDSVGYCAPEAYCSDAFQCVPAPVAGQPCVTSGEDYYHCAPGNHCGDSLTVCIADVPLGGACEVYANVPELDCAEGLRCFCGPISCAAGSCLEKREEGDPCDDGTGACMPGLECRSGRCAATDELTIFEQDC
jgi:hypothetical protein